MKVKKLIAANLITAGLVASGAGLADTNTLTVSASVTGTCKFSSATSSLSFGALDPSSASDASASNTTTYWCTKGVVASTTAGNGSNYSDGSRRMAGSGPSDFIPYSLALVGGAQTGSGPGTPLTLTIDGDIANADYVNATAGSYSDTVTLTITP